MIVIYIIFIFLEVNRGIYLDINKTGYNPCADGLRIRGVTILLPLAQKCARNSLWPMFSRRPKNKLIGKDKTELNFILNK